MTPFDSLVHAEMIQHFLNHGFAPDVGTLAKRCNCPESKTLESLKTLEKEHAVVLHPDRDEIWVPHPFATQPTNFWVTAGDRSWWGNCIWCSLGIAALIRKDVTIETRLGGETETVTLSISDGNLTETDLLAHFTRPIRNAWGNVHFFCGTAMVFRGEDQVDDWCKRHALPKGSIVPVGKIWDLSKIWYVNHASPSWEKPTIGEVNEIFKSVGLNDDFWLLPDKEGTF